jgi:predicted phage terminase large subunit-like protein
MITQSWDTAIKSGAKHDASACATLRYEDGLHYIIDMQSIRLDYPALKRFIVSHARRHNPEAILIEDKASGQSLLQDLRVEYPELPCIAIMPKGDKCMRLARVSPMIEAGKVALPYAAPWLSHFENEMAGFPHAKHDDQVDALSQYLLWFQQRMRYGDFSVRRL